MKDVQRLNAWEQDRQRKLELKRMQKEVEEPEEDAAACSFMPQTIKKEGDRRRTKD